MPWNTKSCLNRWCLRTLQESCDSRLYNYLHHQLGDDVLALPRHQGRPPLKNCCIAPHCDQWQCIDDEHGICQYRMRLSEALRHRSEH